MLEITDEGPNDTGDFININHGRIRVTRSGSFQTAGFATNAVFIVDGDSNHYLDFNQPEQIDVGMGAAFNFAYAVNFPPVNSVATITLTVLEPATTLSWPENGVDSSGVIWYTTDGVNSLTTASTPGAVGAIGLVAFKVVVTDTSTNIIIIGHNP
jgi:hypothetical protein